MAGSQASVVQISLSVQIAGVAPMQVPPWQVSLNVHASLSLHVTSPATALWPQPSPVVQTSSVHTLLSSQSASSAAWAQPVKGWQASIVHGNPSSQLAAAPGTQPPPTHASPTVHKLSSLQPVPLVTEGLLHAPLAGSQVPATWQSSLAVQTMGLWPTHPPPSQLSESVQASLSEHPDPLAAVGLLHAPLVGSQVPATWHWSLAKHETGFTPKQLPSRHRSVSVQESPSLHALPKSAAGLLHAPVAASHAPATWH